MAASNPPTGISRLRLRFIVGAAVVLILAFAGGFSLIYASQPRALSLAQALTIVAQATQTARAANPGAVVAHPTRRALTATSSSNSGPLPSRQPPTQSNLPAGQTAATSGSAPAVLFPPTSSSPRQQNTAADVPTFPVGNVTVRPTYTPKPTLTPTRTFTPAPTRTPTATPGPGLPSLTIGAITGALTTDRGFDCKQEGGDPLFILWMCDYQSGNDLWYHVDIYGTPDKPVSNLLVSVFQTNPDDALAIDILGYAAALPYTGSSPDAARQWVAQTLPGIHSVTDVREKYFGAVRYHLFGGPQGRYLELGVSSQ